MKKEIIILFLIFLLAFFLRIYKLGSIPHTFHEDEVLSGYIGRYIIQNGFDTYGNKWPLWYFNKFGDYYIIGPIYLSGLSTYIFGVNEFAVRFPHAFFGALAIIPMFYFTLEIFKNKKIALLSSLFLAIAPWHVVLSRSTTEGIIGSTLFLTSLVFLLKSIKNKNIIYFIIAFFNSLLTYWTYHPFRIYVPLIFLIFLVIFLKEVKKNDKYFLLISISTIFFFILTFYISQTEWGRGRFLQTSIFSPLSGVTIRLNEIINDEKDKFFLAKIFHNKAVGYTREFLKQYLTYFSPLYLTINGWERLRYHVPEQGLIYFSFLFLTIFSLNFISKEKGRRELLFFLFILFISPLPASLTVIESPNPHRSLFMIMPLIVLISFGFFKLLILFNKKNPIFRTIFILLIIGEFIFFLHQYFTHGDLYSSIVRNDGQKEISSYVIKNLNNYDRIYLPAEAAMSWYYLFYKQDFNPEYSKRFKLDTRIESTGKVYYIENSCPTTIVNPYKLKNKKILIIDRPSCQSDESRWRFIKYINGVNILLKYKVFEN